MLLVGGLADLLQITRRLLKIVLDLYAVVLRVCLKIFIGSGLVIIGVSVFIIFFLINMNNVAWRTKRDRCWLTVKLSLRHMPALLMIRRLLDPSGLSNNEALLSGRKHTIKIISDYYYIRIKKRCWGRRGQWLDFEAWVSYLMRWVEIGQRRCEK